MRHLDRLKGFRQGADLVDLDQDRVGNTFRDAAAQPLRIGDEQIVADELHLAAQFLGQCRPTAPIVLIHAVFDRQDRIARHEICEIADHAVGIERLALARQLILAVLEELAGGAVERQHDIITGRIARRFDRLHNKAQRLVGRADTGCEAALVADIGVVAGILQRLLQRLEDLRPDPHAVRQRSRRHRHDHELLDVDRIVRVRAAIDDVHHRHRQGACIGAADIAIERQSGILRSRLGHRQRHAEHRIGAEPRLVRRAIEIDHHAVDLDLIVRVHTAQQIEDLAIDRIDGLANPLAAIAAIAVAQFQRFILAGGCARRDAGAAKGPAFQGHIDLDGRVTAAVENFARVDIENGGHGYVASPGQSISL